MANPIATNSSKTYLYVDTSFLYQLYAAGGLAAWDTMFSSGDTIVVTSIIKHEMGQHDLNKEFDRWMKKNKSRIFDPDVSVDELNKAYPRPVPFSLAKTKQDIGDYSIRLHIANTYEKEPNRKMQLLASDYRFVDDEIRKRNADYDKSRVLAPHRGVFGFLRSELLEGRLTDEKYDAFTTRLRSDTKQMDSIKNAFHDRGETAHELKASKEVWKTGDYPDSRYEDDDYRRFREKADRRKRKLDEAKKSTDTNKDGGGNNLLGTPKPGDVLRAVGVIGDVVEFTQVVEESSKLIEQDRTPEAEQLLFAYVGGIGGSAAGGAAAGMAAGAAISATGVGALVGVPLAIVSVLVGGYLGDAAGREFTSYVVREIQTRQANGETIVVDDIIELFEDYSDANDLDIEGLTIPKSELDLSGLNSQTGPWGLVDENGEFQPFNMGPYYGQAVDARQSNAEAVPGQTMAELQGDTAFNRVNKAHALVTTAGQSAGFEAAMGQDIDLLPHGVRKGFDRRRSQIESANGTNNEQLPEVSPVLRPRPKLNPITEGYLKDMPDDGRLILAAEMVGYNGRKEADKAEAARLARFDVQRKMAQDLEDIKVGRVSTVWDRYGHPKAVRDLLGEEAYQSFVDDRLEAGLIAHATAGLHLLQDAELFGIVDGTTNLEAPHEKLAELMTPKVLAAAAERARDILDMRRTKPSEAVLLSADLSNRKAQFDAAFDAKEAVDAEEMDAFLFYHEAAQREIGIAEPAIEMIPPRWASQVAARFEAPEAGNGTPTDRRAREAELKQHYTQLQQSFGPRTDDVIAYSLARTASNGALSVGPIFQLDLGCGPFMGDEIAEQMAKRCKEMCAERAFCPVKSIDAAGRSHFSVLKDRACLPAARVAKT